MKRITEEKKNVSLHHTSQLQGKFSFCTTRLPIVKLSTRHFKSNSAMEITINEITFGVQPKVILVTTLLSFSGA